MGKAKYSPCGAEQRSRASKASSSQQPAIDAALLLILVDVLRQLQAQHCASLALGRAAHLVARFRALVEAEYRRHRPLSDMAAALGVTLSTLCLCGRGRLPPGHHPPRVYLSGSATPAALCHPDGRRDGGASGLCVRPSLLGFYIARGVFAGAVPAVGEAIGVMVVQC